MNTLLIPFGNSSASLEKELPSHITVKLKGFKALELLDMIFVLSVLKTFG
jgi:hypothetical protein